MDEQFLLWAKEHINELLAREIVSEIPDLTEEIKEKKLQNPCQVVYFYTEAHTGYVSVWRSGYMDMEILDNETEKTAYYRHLDDIRGLTFDNLLKEFFQAMV